MVDVVSEIVTKFFLDTCRPRRPLRRHCAQATELCAILASQHPDNEAEANIVPLTTGSVAEFYIEPMLPYVGDVDIMFHFSTWLAMPRGHPPPTQLPAEFHNYVKVCEIVDSHLPGYVYLELRYLLTECIDDKYNYFEYDNGLYLTHHTYGHSENSIHGPALLTNYLNISLGLLPVDNVHCVRCLSWPAEAADWPSRHRNWPDSSTVDCVVSNGCDVVNVAHRQCREDEWMGKYQWRLSFSRAEIVLINSWLPVQQIVYHMLRFLLKSEQLIDSVDSSERVISNYHIKTLVLWTCELKSKSWWTERLTVVRICVELFHTLSDWLIDAWCISSTTVT